MSYYWVRTKRGQVAAEVSETALSVHDQKLSWQLHELRDTGDSPFAQSDGAQELRWNLGTLLRFFEENGYTIERQDT
jgi:hypothetical protein